MSRIRCRSNTRVTTNKLLKKPAPLLAGMASQFPISHKGEASFLPVSRVSQSRAGHLKNLRKQISPSIFSKTKTFMEQEIQNQDPLFGLNIDPLIKSHLSETARWGKFLSIIGFIFCALIAIVGIFFVSLFSTVDRRYGSFDGPPITALGPAVMVMYIVIAIVYFFPCLFLLRFSNKMKNALATDNQADLTTSFQNLKVLFRYVGILTIIALSLYLLALLFGGLGAMMGSR